MQLAKISWIVTGMIALTCANVLAQNNASQQPSFNGIVLSAHGDGSFVIVDRSGMQTKLKVSPETSFQFNRNASTYTEVIKIGANVRGTFTPAGQVMQVSSNGQPGQLRVSQLQVFLGATDEEWSLLKAKIDRIESLRREAEGQGGGNNGNGGNGGANGNQPQYSRVQALHHSLQGAFFAGASSDELKQNLSALRDARVRAREALQNAQRELIDLVTPRQESLLVVMGILD